MSDCHLNLETVNEEQEEEEEEEEEDDNNGLYVSYPDRFRSSSSLHRQNELGSSYDFRTGPYRNSQSDYKDGLFVNHPFSNYSGLSRSLHANNPSDLHWEYSRNGHVIDKGIMADSTDSGYGVDSGRGGEEVEEIWVKGAHGGLINNNNNSNSDIPRKVSNMSPQRTKPEQNHSTGVNWGTRSGAGGRASGEGRTQGGRTDGEGRSTQRGGMSTTSLYKTVSFILDC